MQLELDKEEEEEHLFVQR